MLRLLTTPIRIGFAVTGRVLDTVRSVLPGSRESEMAPSATVSHESGAPASRPSKPSEAAATTEHPTGRDASASDWDEDAPVPPGGSDPDDLVVLDRVKTEIFRPGDAEKGSVNVNVENGVVYLRGDVDDPDQAEYFEVAAAAVEGVIRVENLIGTSS